MKKRSFDFLKTGEFWKNFAVIAIFVSVSAALFWQAGCRIF
jgi:hypothetical protein